MRSSASINRDRNSAESIEDIALPHRMPCTERASAPAQLADTALPLLDLELLKTFAAQRRAEWVDEVVSIFMSELSKKQLALGSIVDMTDRSELLALSHGLAGACSMIGAARLATRSKAIERACKSTDALDWSEVVAYGQLISDTHAAFSAIKAADLKASSKPTPRRRQSRQKRTGKPRSK